MALFVFCFVFLSFSSNICWAEGGSGLAKMQQKVVAKNQLYTQIPLIHTQIRGKINTLFSDWNKVYVADEIHSRQLINQSEASFLEAAKLIVYANNQVCGNYEKNYGSSADVCSRSRVVEKQMALMAQEREYFLDYLNSGQCTRDVGFGFIVKGNKKEKYRCSFLEAKQRHLNSMIHYSQRVRDKLIY